MRTVFYAFFFIFFCTACGPKIYLQQLEQTTFSGRELPFQEISNTKKAPEKLAMLISQNPDTLRLAHSPLVKILVAKGYKVLIPGKPGTNHFEKQDLDTKEYRIKDLEALISMQDSLLQIRPLLIGIGEGGYLVPSLAGYSQPEKYILINTGLYSTLTEYETMLEHPVKNDSALEHVVRYNNLYSVEHLKENIDKLKENEFGQPLLKGGTNHYWLSYQRQPLMDDLSKLTAPGLWLVSKDYPLISHENKELIKVLAENFVLINYQQLESIGNFNNADEMESLAKAVEGFINNPN